MTRNTFLVGITSKAIKMFYHHVVCSVRDAEILRAIVSFVAIYMVNDFVRAKRSPEMLFHHITMLRDTSTIDRDHHVAIRANPTRAIRRLHSPQRRPVALPAVVMLGAPSAAKVRILAARYGTHFHEFIITHRNTTA